jgi:hypothetical protein
MFPIGGSYELGSISESCFISLMTYYSRKLDVKSSFIVLDNLWVRVRVCDDLARYRVGLAGEAGFKFLVILSTRSGLRDFNTFENPLPVDLPFGSFCQG